VQVGDFDGQSTFVDFLMMSNEEPEEWGEQDEGDAEADQGQGNNEYDPGWADAE
jgi:hypothetical protein